MSAARWSTMSTASTPCRRLARSKTASSYAQVAGGGFNMMVAAARTGMKVVFGGQHRHRPEWRLPACCLRRRGHRDADPAVARDGHRQLRRHGHRRCRAHFRVVARCRRRAAARHAWRPSRLLPGDWVFTSGYTLSYPGSRDALADWIEALPGEFPFVFDPTPVMADIPRPILSRVLARTNWLSCNADGSRRHRRPGRCRDACGAAARRAIARRPMASSSAPATQGLPSCGSRTAASQTIPGFKVDGGRHQWRRRHPYRRLRQRAGARRRARSRRRATPMRRPPFRSPATAARRRRPTQEIQTFPEPGRRSDRRAAVRTKKAINA